MIFQTIRGFVIGELAITTTIKICVIFLKRRRINEIIISYKTGMQIRKNIYIILKGEQLQV